MAKKRILFISIVFLLIIALVAGTVYALLFVNKTIEAFVLPEKGLVEIDSGVGFRAISTQTPLYEDNLIRTGPHTSAVVIIHESILITLESNTQVSLADLTKDNVKVEQQKGSTWNKFTKLNGVTDYTLVTPTSVAAVRGTEFGMNLDRILVAEGVVDLEAKGQLISVKQEEKVEWGKGNPKKQPLTPRDREYMIGQLETQIKQLQNLRAREVQEHGLAMKLLQAKIGPASAPIEEIFNAADKGQIDIKQARKEVPFNAEWVDTIFTLTERIQEQHIQIDRLRKIDSPSNKR